MPAMLADAARPALPAGQSGPAEQRLSLLHATRDPRREPHARRVLVVLIGLGFANRPLDRFADDDDEVPADDPVADDLLHVKALLRADQAVDIAQVDLDRVRAVRRQLHVLDHGPPSAPRAHDVPALAL